MTPDTFRIVTYTFKSYDVTYDVCFSNILEILLWKFDRFQLGFLIFVYNIYIITRLLTFKYLLFLDSICLIIAIQATNWQIIDHIDLWYSITLKFWWTFNVALLSVITSLDSSNVIWSLLQLRRNPSGKTNDQIIHDIMFPLGRRHVAFGSNPFDMEVLGILMHKSLMQGIPKERIELEKYEDIENAFLELFKSIVYWLQFSFNSENRSIVWFFEIWFVAT